MKSRYGSYTGSSNLVIRPEIASANVNVISTLLNARSNPSKLAGLLGSGFLFKLMLGTVGIKDFETHMSNVLNMKCGVVLLKYPEFFFSLENVDDIKLAEKYKNFSP